MQDTCRVASAVALQPPPRAEAAPVDATATIGATETRTPARRGRLLVSFLACVAFATAVSLRFYAEQWNGYDDGAYLHIADRMLQGEVLHRDVQDMHLGYVNFLNAGAMWLFGNDAISLRYPLLAMGILSGALAFWLAADAGPLCAAAASVAMTCLSYIQFMNPTANWHCMFLCLVILAVMKATKPAGAFRHVALGTLVAAVVLFRHLSGVLAAAAVLLWLLMEIPPRRGSEETRQLRDTWLARGVLLVTAGGLGLYTIRSAGVVTSLLYGLWPLALLTWGVRNTRAANGDAARMLLRFSLGAAAATFPLLAYHAYHGSVRPWLDDTVFTALGFTGGLKFDRIKYVRTMVGGVRCVLRPTDLVDFLTGAFWAVAPFLPVLLGAVAVRAAWTSSRRDAPTTGDDRSTGVNTITRTGSRVAPGVAVLTPLTVLAVFYFLAALHFQKYMYFFFAVPLTFVALAAVLPAAGLVVRRAGLVTLFMLSAVALLLFAAPFPSVVPGGAVELMSPSEHGLPRLGLYFRPTTVEHFRKVIKLVDGEVAPDEAILVLPCGPQYYYLTGRRNPTRISYAVLGIRSRQDAAALERQFEREPPRLVLYAPAAHHNSQQTRELMQWVAARYEDAGTLDGYRVYRSRAPRPPSSRPATAPATAPAAAPGSPPAADSEDAG